MRAANRCPLFFAKYFYTFTNLCQLCHTMPNEDIEWQPRIHSEICGIMCLRNGIICHSQVTKLAVLAAENKAVPLQRNQNVKRYGKGNLSQRLDRRPALGNDTRVPARRVAAAATSAPKNRCKIPHSSGDGTATTHIARDTHRLG